jgi:hypothetical protein
MSHVRCQARAMSPDLGPTHEAKRFPSKETCPNTPCPVPGTRLGWWGHE